MRTIAVLFLVLTISVGYLIAQEPEPVMEPVLEEVKEVEPIMEEVIKKHIVPNQQQALDHISDFLLKGEIINMLAAWSTFLKNPENKDVNIDTAIQYIIQKVEKQRTALFEPRENITMGEFRAKIEGEITRTETIFADLGMIEEDPKGYLEGAICGEAIDFKKLRQKYLDYLKWLQTSVDSLDEEIKKYEKKLKQLDDDAQLANIDLQGMLKKQQQRIDMMKSIIKMLHNTAMAVIRKMG